MNEKERDRDFGRESDMLGGMALGEALISACLVQVFPVFRFPCT